METKFNVSKETLTQMILKNYEYRIDSFTKEDKQLEEIVKHHRLS